MSGRKRDPIWKYFNEENKQSITNKKAVCKKCGAVMQGMVSRLQKHKIKCTDEPLSELVTIDASHSETEDADEDEVSLAKLRRRVLLSKSLTQNISSKNRKSCHSNEFP